MDLIARCNCGYQWRVSEYALGSTGVCPSCDKPIRLSPANTIPADIEQEEAVQEEPAAPYSEAAAQFEDPFAVPEPREVPPGHCPYCGKKYRGEWDRVQTLAGVLCNICANRAGEGAHAQTFAQQQYAAEPDTAPEPKSIPLPEQERDYPRLSDYNTFQKVVLVLGIMVVLIGLVVLVFPDQNPAQRQERATTLPQDAGFDPNNEYSPNREFLERLEREKARKEGRIVDPKPEMPNIGLPSWVEHMAFWILLFSGIVVEWLALFVALNVCERLPNDNFLANVFGLLPMSIFCWIFGTAVPTLLPNPCFTLTILTYSFLTVFVMSTFNLRGWEVAQYFVIRLVIVGLYGTLLAAAAAA